LICTELGGYSWEKVGRIWYRTLEDRNLKPTASFEDFANSTIASAKSLANEISDWTGKEYEAVIRAWKQVEVL
jgi:Zn-dependent metalloprotease